MGLQMIRDDRCDMPEVVLDERVMEADVGGSQDRQNWVPVGDLDEMRKSV